MDRNSGYLLLVIVLALAGVVNSTFTIEIKNSAASSKSSKSQAPDIGLGTPIRTDIVKVLTSDKRFTALANAVAIAGMVPTLMSGGSFITFFAPTNDAFRALPLPELNDLIANPSKMKQFLLGHMVYGKIAGPDLRSGDLRFENGDVGKATVTRGGITIGGALVLQTDMTAFNGVVHAIDRVIEHEPPPTLGRLLSEDNRFSIFVRAATAAGLMSTLESAGPHTVFAPTNAAFRSLPPGVLDKMMSNPRRLRRVVLSHLAAGKVMGADLRRGDQKIVNGPISRMIVSRSGGTPGRKATARVIQADIPAANGVVHVIDSVI